MLGIIHSILIRENNPRVLNFDVSVLQSRENSKNVIKPSVLLKSIQGAFLWRAGCEPLPMTVWEFHSANPYYWDLDTGTGLNIFITIEDSACEFLLGWWQVFVALSEFGL